LADSVAALMDEDTTEDVAAVEVMVSDSDKVELMGV
jgi:hypothetical protein